MSATFTAGSEITSDGYMISSSSGSGTIQQSAGKIEVTITSGNTSFTAVNINDFTPVNLSDGDGSCNVTTAAGSDTIKTGGGNDTIKAGSGNDFVDGGFGDDFLQGEDGDDYLTVQVGNNKLEGGNGRDLLVASTGNDSLDGGTGNDILISGAGDDTLVGGAGNDRLQGGPGKDVLIGGAGKDKFRFEKAAISKDPKQVDVIDDFDPKGEVIEFARTIFNGSVKPAKGKANEFGCKSLMNESDFATVQRISDGVGSAKIVYESSTGLVYANTKQGLTALVQLDTGLNMSASNFELFY